jgi:hypothetical protein
MARTSPDKKTHLLTAKWELPLFLPTQSTHLRTPMATSRQLKKNLAYILWDSRARLVRNLFSSDSTGAAAFTFIGKGGGATDRQASVLYLIYISRRSIAVHIYQLGILNHFPWGIYLSAGNPRNFENDDQCYLVSCQWREITLQIFQDLR